MLKEKLGEYGSDLHFPRARAPAGRDAAWLFISRARA
jgi:hypothetical protein